MLQIRAVIISFLITESKLHMISRKVENKLLIFQSLINIFFENFAFVFSNEMRIYFNKLIWKNRGNLARICSCGKKLYITCDILLLKESMQK